MRLPDLSEVTKVLRIELGTGEDCRMRKLLLHKSLFTNGSADFGIILVIYVAEGEKILNSTFETMLTVIPFP